MAKGTCSIEGCAKKAFGRGWCHMHWNRWRRHGDPLFTKFEMHGLSYSSEYGIWKHVCGRCLDPKEAGYENYGGRGITVCDEWRTSFSAFYRDMGPRPSKSHSIDRINNDGHYTPENCRWATPTEQCNNTRKNTFLTFGGETMTWTQWARKLDISRETIVYRVQQGWPIERVLSSSLSTMGRPRTNMKVRT